MQNDFEKQVRQKMEELDFVPSAPVWEKVKEQIRQKRKRRRMIVWLPLFFLMAAGGWWFIYDQSGSNSDATSAASEIRDNLPEIIRKDGYANSPVAIEKNNTPVPVQPKNVKDLSSARKFSIDKKQMRVKTSTATFEQNIIKKEKEVTGVKETRKVDLPLAGLDQQVTVGKRKSENKNSDPVQQAVFREKLFHLDEKNLLPEIKPVMVVNVIARENIVTDNTFPLSPDSGTVVSSFPKKKWNVGIHTSVGISGISKGLNLFNAEKLFLDAGNALNSPSTPQGQPANNDSVSPIKNNLFFSAGAVAKKSIGRRFQFITGLHLNYYSSYRMVGKDSVFFGSFAGYSIGQMEKFNNRFLAVSLPVGIGLRVFKNMPLYVQASVSVQQLIGVKALQYNNNSGMYVYDKQNFNRTMLFSSLGFSYTLPLNNCLIELGPELHYGLSRLQKNGSNEHLYSLGMSARIFFLKK